MARQPFLPGYEYEKIGDQFHVYAPDGSGGDGMLIQGVGSILESQEGYAGNGIEWHTAEIDQRVEDIKAGNQAPMNQDDESKSAVDDGDWWKWG